MKNYINLTNEKLIAEAVSNKEGIIAANGAFSTTTGKRTGRSPNDRYIVKEPSTESSIDWGNINKPFAIDDFEKLCAKKNIEILERTTVDHAHQISLGMSILPNLLGEVAIYRFRSER